MVDFVNVIDNFSNPQLEIYEGLLVPKVKDERW